jgi:AraC-like DNA-binding protein
MKRSTSPKTLAYVRPWIWFGVPPMHYLVSWRMQVATQKLRNTNASIAQVADLVGYDSEAAFSRAFKKTIGVAPATWRRSNS